jgi:acetolactate synthase small subunit
MSDNWKNDRAEAYMREQEAKNVAKAAAEFKAKQNEVKTNSISIEITGTKAEEVTMNFLKDLAVIQSKHTSIDAIIGVNLKLDK